MSQYAENNLTKGETIVLKAKKSWLALLPQILWCVILLVGIIVGLSYLSKLGGGDSGSSSGGSSNMGTTIILILFGVWFLIGVLPLIVKIIRLATMCLCVTNKRVIGKVGVLKIHTLDFPIEKVDNVAIKAGVLGNLFHFHSVRVLGGGSAEDANIAFGGISNATAFKNAVTEAVEKHAEEARRAQAEEIARAMGR